MDMEVRRLSGEERFEANRISVVAFHMRVEDMEKLREDSLKKTEEDWGAFSDDGTSSFTPCLGCLYWATIVAHGRALAASRPTYKGRCEEWARFPPTGRRRFPPCVVVTSTMTLST